jgi:hypothetical protein
VLKPSQDRAIELEPRTGSTSGNWSRSLAPQLFAVESFSPMLSAPPKLSSQSRIVSATSISDDQVRRCSVGSPWSCSLDRLAVSGPLHAQNCGIICGGRLAIEPDRHAGLERIESPSRSRRRRNVLRSRGPAARCACHVANGPSGNSSITNPGVGQHVRACHVHGRAHRQDMQPIFRRVETATAGRSLRP